MRVNEVTIACQDNNRWNKLEEEYKREENTSPNLALFLLVAIVTDLSSARPWRGMGENKNKA